MNLEEIKKYGELVAEKYKPDNTEVVVDNLTVGQMVLMPTFYGTHWNEIFSNIHNKIKKYEADAIKYAIKHKNRNSELLKLPESNIGNKIMEKLIDDAFQTHYYYSERRNDEKMAYRVEKFDPSKIIKIDSTKLDYLRQKNLWSNEEFELIDGIMKNNDLPSTGRPFCGILIEKCTIEDTELCKVLIGKEVGWFPAARVILHPNHRKSDELIRKP